MSFAKARLLRFDKCPVGGHCFGDDPPGILEVPFIPIALLTLQVLLFDSLEQRRVVPRRSVIDPGRVSARGHRYEVPVVLEGVYVLGLVELHQQTRRSSYDRRDRPGRKEYRPGQSQPDHVAELRLPSVL